MSLVQRYTAPYVTAFDTLGVVAPGALLFFYLTGTSTPSNTYSDVGLTIPNSNPVVADGAGLFPSIFLVPGITYKVVLKTSGGDQIWTADPVALPSTPIPTRTILLTGTGATYTPPAGARQIHVRMVGGGGGGASNAGGASNGSSGGTTSFNGITTIGGGGGNASGNAGLGGTGGSNTPTSGSIYGMVRQPGNAGGSGINGTGSTSANGGGGAPSIFGGGSATGSAAANTGAGGVGQSVASLAEYSGGGGASGESADFFINGPTGSYLYTIGAGGSGGTGGGNAGSGIIIIEEYF